MGEDTKLGLVVPAPGVGGDDPLASLAGATLTFSRPAASPASDERLPEEPILRFFKYEHLPPALAKTSAPFAELAEHLVITIPRSPERTIALRKLLEAKDAAVRAALPPEGA